VKPRVALSLAIAGLLLSGPAQGDERGIEDFPDRPGREETADLCAACHSGRLVSQQGMTREQWNDTLDLMTARHNMPRLTGEERERILSYLVQAFPPKSRRKQDNPFLR
jgi:hypothetical protein